MKSSIFAPIKGGQAKVMPENDSVGVVEIGLLLPAGRAAELVQLAKDRRESVGQILRKLIERELAKTA